MPVDISPPDVSIRELEQLWGLSRNGLKARAKALGVELRRVSSTLTVWPGEYVPLGQALHEHLATGQPMGTFPGLKPGGEARPEGAAVVSSVPSPVVPAPTGAVVPAMPAAVVPSVPSAVVPSVQAAGTSAGLAELVAALQQLVPPPPPPPDPLARARGLAEAADRKLVLGNAELGALLGKDVSSWKEDAFRHGYWFRRHKPEREVLWTVERGLSGSGSPAPAAAPSAGRPASLGFLRDEAIEARATVLARVELPRW